MSCTKERSRNALEAKLRMLSMDYMATKHRKQSNRELPVRTYPCPRCGGHHLTSH